jgi:hypothetical protein
MPAEINVTSAGRAGERAGAAIAPGVCVVIADLAATTFCDITGGPAFVLARRHAIEHGAALRLVVLSATVQHVFGVTKLDRLPPIYPSLSAAMAPAVEAGAYHYTTFDLERWNSHDAHACRSDSRNGNTRSRRTRACGDQPRRTGNGHLHNR